MLSLRSKLTQDLLLFFFLNPIEERYLHELSKILNVPAQNLHKKLKELENAGLFKSKIRGRERYYSLNCNWPLYWEYKSIFEKTLGIPDIVAENLETIRYLKAVYINADAPRDVQKEIQIFILKRPDAYGIPSEKAILKVLKRLQKELKRKITVNYLDNPPQAEGYLRIL